MNVLVKVELCAAKLINGNRVFTGAIKTRLNWQIKTKLGRFISDVSDEKTDARWRHDDDEAKRRYRRRRRRRRRRQSLLHRSSSNGRHR